MTLRLYNTLTRSVEEFKPSNPDNVVRMYCCGPTVYNYAHIGNLRTYVFEDLLRKTIKRAGFSLKHAINITDVGHLTSDADDGDDKMLLAAEKEKLSVLEIARKYEDTFFKHTAALNIERPDIVCRATEHVEDMIKFVKKLEDKGYAYVSNGNVYYDTAKFPRYGCLSGQNREELKHGSRVEQDTNKRNPSDFVLWFTVSKFKDQILQWDSPWGRGYPGWHIECSTMAMKYLGEHLDIHCGGVDHIAVHHENEIAQSEAATGHQFARTWMHSGPLRVRSADGKEEKMSKSLGNFWTIRDALKETNAAYGEGCGAEVLRFFLLRSQYRSPITFSSVLIEEAHKALVRLYTALKGRAADRAALDWNEPFAARFKAAMDDDFNTALAVSVLFELATEINRTGSPELVRQLLGLGRILNILGMDPEKFLQGGAEASDDASRIEGLIEERALAKKAKNFARADEIRKSLLAEGIELQDGAAGTTWRRI